MSETIVDAHDVFKFIDEDFKRWGFGSQRYATRKTSAEAYGLWVNATIKEMFTPLSSSNLGALCVTEHQVKLFCKEYQDRMGTRDYLTFFLTKRNPEAPATFDNLFAVCVEARQGEGGLNIYIYGFEYGRMWCAGDHRSYLVVPKLFF